MADAKVIIAAILNDKDVTGKVGALGGLFGGVSGQAAGIGQALGSILPQITSIIPGLGGIGKTLAGAAGSAGGLGGAIGALAGPAAIAAAAVAAIGAGIKYTSESLSVFAEFEVAMSQLEATTFASASQMSQLEAAAQQAGSTTVFSATQAAEAMNYLAQAGYDTNTIIALLPQTLLLAQAGAMDLATATDYAVGNINALGLGTSEVPAYFDAVAKSAQVTNSNVSELLEGVKQLGALGRNAAGGYQELVTLMGILANVGIKGAEAGTHLRNMLLSLTSPSAEAADLMESLNVSAGDAAGNLRPVAEIIWDIGEAISGMSQTQQMDVLGTIFNTRDLAAATAILNTSRETYNGLMSDIASSQGVMQQMADIQTNNIAGLEQRLTNIRQVNKEKWGEIFADTKKQWLEFQMDIAKGWGEYLDNMGKTGYTAHMDSLEAWLRGIYSPEEIEQAILDYVGDYSNVYGEGPRVIQANPWLMMIPVDVHPEVKQNTDGYMFDPEIAKIVIADAGKQISDMFGEDGYTVSIPTTIDISNFKINASNITTSALAQKIREAIASKAGDGGSPVDLFGAGYWAEDSGFSTQIAAQMAGGLSAGIIKALENLDIDGLTDDIKGVQGDRISEILTNALFSGEMDLSTEAQQKLADYIGKMFSATELEELLKTTDMAGLTDGLINSMLSALSSGNLEAVDTEALSIVFSDLISKGLSGAGVGLSLNDKSAISSSIKSSFEEVINSTVLKVDPALELGDGIETKAQGMFEPVGGAIASGIADGIRSGQGEVNAAVLEIAESAKAAMLEALKSHSPSRVFMDIGKFVPQGFALGITRGMFDVRGDIESAFALTKPFALTGLARAQAEAMDNRISAINMSTLSGGGKSRDLVISIDGRELARATVDDIFNEADRKAILRRR